MMMPGALGTLINRKTKEINVPSTLVHAQHMCTNHAIDRQDGEAPSTSYVWNPHGRCLVWSGILFQPKGEEKYLQHKGTVGKAGGGLMPRRVTGSPHWREPRCKQQPGGLHTPSGNPSPGRPAVPLLLVPPVPPLPSPATGSRPA